MTRTEGQHGALTLEYTNRSGQVVCKKVADDKDYLITYYAYDDLGRLSWVITPKAVQATGGSLSNVPEDLCYRYTYNQYGQVISRNIPGKETPDETVYDARHRPIMSRTALLADDERWAWQVYDSRGRVVFSGFVESDDSRGDWQSLIDAGNAQPGTLAWYLIHECNDNYPAALPDCEINDYSYYDSYDFPSGLSITGQGFDNRHNSILTNGLSTPAQAPATYAQGLLTAKRSRVLDNTTLPNQWVSTVLFYDQKGRLIQTQTLNAWNTSAWDVTTTLLRFDGQPAITVSDFNSPPGCHKPVTRIRDNYAYTDLEGKPAGQTRTMDNATTAFPVSAYTYGDLGQPSANMLGGVENQRYTFDISGRMTGINRDFVYGDVPDATFGVDICYDHGLSANRYDGQVAGIIWRGAGTNTPLHAYGYSYDKAGRMTAADYFEQDFLTLAGSPSWHRDVTDYSVSGIKYDPNGNLMAMKQRGNALAGGQVQPVDLDDLKYEYRPNSNTLDNVADGVHNDYGLGDFVDHNQNGSDYDYDPDGNLKTDRNKGISKISYNAQDLPLTVTGTGGSVQNTYDASGALLEKTITPAGGSPETWRYVGPVVIKDQDVSYCLHPEGRSRWVADSNLWRHDVFVKDHLGNVRNVVTSYVSPPVDYVATYENTAAAVERSVFDHIDEVRDDNPMATAADLKVALLDGSDANKRIGSALMVKVMAGDRINLSVDATYPGPDDLSPDADHVPTGEIVAALAGALTGGAAIGGTGEGSGGANAQVVQQMLGGNEFANAYGALRDGGTVDPVAPRAYLSYVFFDEQMKLVSEQSGVLQVTSDGRGQWTTLSRNGVVMGRNGYFAVFLHSEDTRAQVAFNDLRVAHSKGQLLEENHYYPFGLVAGLGQHNPVANRFLYQGKQLQDEAGLQLYDFGARQYDPQIGRFWGIDPMDQYPSGYTGMGNNPVSLVDPTGMLTEAKITARDDLSVAAERPSGGEDFTRFSFYGDEEMSDRSDRLWKESDEAEAQGNTNLGLLSNFNKGIKLGALAAFADGTGISSLTAGRGVGISLGAAAEGIGLTIDGASAASTWGALGMTAFGVALPSNWNGPRGGDVMHPGFNIPGANYEALYRMRRDYGNLAKYTPAILTALATYGGNANDQVYRLYAKADGIYPVVQKGVPGMAGSIPMKAGDTWKFGRTSRDNVYGSSSNSRYNSNMPEYKFPSGIGYETIYRGNILQTKFVEHMQIMQYMFIHNMTLPPGNRVPW